MTKFLFTTLPTNDLGLLTRSLPIAKELAAHGHNILFCSPALAPSRLIAEAGFENLLPRHPLYEVMRMDRSLRGVASFLSSGQYRQRNGSLFNFLRELLPALPIKSAPDTLEVWNMDHAGAMMGMLNEGFVRANVEALREMMIDSGADVVVEACIAALAGEEVHVVLTTGHHPLPKEVLPLPANFRHEPYLPGLAMAERSDLLIHHGGYGSCQTGLYTGKPAVIIPTYSERESNARRIAALGAGAIVPVEKTSGKKSVRSEKLRATVRRVLSDPSFAEAARQTGERLRAYGGAPQAAGIIERFSQKLD